MRSSILTLALALGFHIIVQQLAQTRYPILVIKSQSMYPAFSRGDIVFLSNRTTDVHVGDIPAVWFTEQDQPMIHRIIRVWEESVMFSQEQHNTTVFVTKGDNNDVDDMSLYPIGRSSVRRNEVLGFAIGYLPRMGWPALWLREVWWAKWCCALAGLLATVVP